MILNPLILLVLAAVAFALGVAAMTDTTFWWSMIPGAVLLGLFFFSLFRPTKT